MSITFDYDYNKKLVDQLNPYYQNYWEPYFYDKRSPMKGGSMYIRPGTSPVYPVLDMEEQRIYDRGSPSKSQAILKKGGAHKPSHSDVAFEIANSFDGSELSGGAINWDRVREIATPILKIAISKGLDVGAPALGGLIGTTIGGPAGAAVGTFVGKVGRELIKQQTGYGRTNKDVGVYKGGCDSKANSKAKCKKGGAKPKPKPKSKAKNEGTNRHEMVKRVMKEKGMSLPQASKYIKDNNMY